MKNYLISLIGLFFVVFASAYSFAADSYHHETVSESPEDSEFSGKLENAIRVIEIKASRYKFEPDPVVVKFGEKVRLVATSTDVNHGIAISEFKVNLSIPAGKTETVEFIADKKGIFHAYCSVYCGSGHSHMQASFIVK